jgi:glycosyl hydrolase family 20
MDINLKFKNIKLWAAPHEMRVSEGSFIAKATYKLILSMPNEASDCLCAESIRCGFTVEHQLSKDWFISFDGKYRESIRRRLKYIGTQGYILQINNEGIRVAANSQQGLFYALQNLAQLRNDNSFPYIEIIDKPNALYRGIMIDLARVPERPDYIISLLPFLASCRINQVYFNLENKFEYKKHPILAHQHAWSQEDMKRVIDEAEKYFIEVVPIPSTIGHMESFFKHDEYAHLAEPNTCDHLAIYKPEAREFISDILDEICEVFKGDYIHLAGDEAPYLGMSLAKNDTEAKDMLIKSYTDGINFMADRIKSSGKHPMIWADMVLHYPELLQNLDKDIILVDWKYHGLDEEEVTSPEELLRAGFEVAIAPGILADEPFLPSLERLERNIPYFTRRTGMWGIINCMWEPRTQTLPVAKIGIAVAGACAWNPFNINISTILSDASEFVYGQDISDMYKLLATGYFFDKMVETQFNFSSSFEFSCNNPATHMSDYVDVSWQAVIEDMDNGLEKLETYCEFRKKYPTDYNAFKACGFLGKCLASWISLMQKMGAADKFGKDHIDQLRNLVHLMKNTLKTQRTAWDSTRFINDKNFDWWFTDPLECKIKCIEKLALEIKESQNINHKMIVFNVNKGDAPLWNLLRIKILFSNDKTIWKQIFFKTAPLWMSEGFSFKLMPAETLPEWIKIEFSCWTWRDKKAPWTKMINWEIAEVSKGKKEINLKYKIETKKEKELILHLSKCF